jgi:hypothetical protein
MISTHNVYCVSDLGFCDYQAHLLQCYAILEISSYVYSQLITVNKIKQIEDNLRDCVPYKYRCKVIIIIIFVCLISICVPMHCSSRVYFTLLLHIYHLIDIKCYIKKCLHLRLVLVAVALFLEKPRSLS